MRNDGLSAFQAAHSAWIAADFRLYNLERDLQDLKGRIAKGQVWLSQRRFLPLDKTATGRSLMDRLELKAKECRADILEAAREANAAREAMDVAEEAALKAASDETRYR